MDWKHLNIIRLIGINSNNRLLGSMQQKWYNSSKVVIFMETKDIIRELRTKNGFSQDELAEKIHVTRQAVSRWETGVSQS